MKRITLCIAFVALIFSLQAQVFEQPKIDTQDFENVKVKVGGDFTLQFQGLSHTADAKTLIPLGSNFNLPTANLNLEAMLSKGVMVNLTTYLSARHHNEAWVKGGYLLVDRLPFVSEGFLNDMMDNLTIKIGVDEANYGDAHFRRTDNGRAIANAFVGNYIMDAFTTAALAEVYYRKNGIIAMGAIGSGTLKPAVAGYNNTTKEYEEYNAAEELTVYFKGGYDKQINEMVRLRGTVSGYFCGNQHSGSLYGGDRAGSRYYLVMNSPTTVAADAIDITKNAFSGRWGPGSHDKVSSIMVNLFAKVKMFEFFGTYETTSGTTTKAADFDFSQIAVEGIFRFGKSEDFYLGCRYNTVSDGNTDMSVNRVQLAGGWNITKSTVAKLEYVNQNYNNFATYGDNAGFKGIMFEATISF